MSINNPDLPSDKKFGYFFSLIFFLSSLYFFYIQQLIISSLFIFLLVVILSFSIMNPRKLNYFKVLWMKLGFFLGSIISPLILGIIYFGIFTPLGLILRILGRDELDLKINKFSKSFWKIKSQDQLISNSFENQF